MRKLQATLKQRNLHLHPIVRQEVAEGQIARVRILLFLNRVAAAAANQTSRHHRTTAHPIHQAVTPYKTIRDSILGQTTAEPKIERTIGPATVNPRSTIRRPMAIQRRRNSRLRRCRTCWNASKTRNEVSPVRWKTMTTLHKAEVIAARVAMKLATTPCRLRQIPPHSGRKTRICRALSHRRRQTRQSECYGVPIDRRPLFLLLERNFERPSHDHPNKVKSSRQCHCHRVM